MNGAVWVSELLGCKRCCLGELPLGCDRCYLGEWTTRS